MMQRLRVALLADTLAVSASERRHAALGALLGIVLSLWALRSLPLHGLWLLAPMGASAIILFGMPASPVAQPWPVIGGYLCSLFAGFVSATFIGSPVMAAGIAVALCLWLMARLNCIHPPGGALALLIVFDQATFMSSRTHTLELVAANVGLLVLTATLINNLIPGRSYPHQPAPVEAPLHDTQDPSPLHRGDLSHEDIVIAMRKMDTFIDIREEDLVKLYQFAIDHAFHRHVGLQCADVMSRDLVVTTGDTTLADACLLLQRHRIKALPVVDDDGRLTGIVTLSDFFRQAGQTQNWQRTAVAQVMTIDVFAVSPDTMMADLVRDVAQSGRHHVPVVDESGKLLGMLTQSDMIAALYHRLALDPQV